jgi:hypothetical protein
MKFRYSQLLVLIAQLTACVASFAQVISGNLTGTIFDPTGAAVPAGNFRFPGLDQFPNINLLDLGAQLGSDPNAPQFGYQNTYQLTDSVSWTKGTHNFKFDGEKLIAPQSFTPRSRGDYEWSFLSDY